LDYQKLLNWPFPAVTRSYTRADSIAIAKGYGAGASTELQADDAPFIDASAPVKALPMSAVALADGEFWQQNPETGIVWQQIIHAQESVRMHQPLPAEGTVVITQKIKDLFDRGAEKGAVMVQEQLLSDTAGQPLATIEVVTVLRGNGGFGGKPQDSSRPEPFPERPADAVLDIATPPEPETMFRLSAEIKVAAQAEGGDKPRAMLRGVGCFGLAGRGVLKIACGNEPARLRAFGVRYAGPMFTGETMRIELWHLREGYAVFRMQAVEREKPVLSFGYVEFE
jgi:acyl dehydratase